MPISQTPTYNLKAVLKETGITADTLRAWERRYGLPMPERTRADIDCIHITILKPSNG